MGQTEGDASIRYAKMKGAVWQGTPVSARRKDSLLTSQQIADLQSWAAAHYGLTIA